LDDGNPAVKRVVATLRVWLDQNSEIHDRDEVKVSDAIQQVTAEMVIRASE